MHGSNLELNFAVKKRALFGAPLTFWGKLLKMKAIKKSAYRQLEDVVGCKWSVSVLSAVASGVNRPGALERHIEGISTKVLSERLRKLTDYGLLHKEVFAEVPPRTEYQLTDYGRQLSAIIAQLKELDQTIKAGVQD